MSNPVVDLIAVSETDGETLSVVGDTYRLVITGEETGGAFAIIDMLIPPQGGPGPHSHADIQETFYVLEGEVVVKTKAQTITAKKGEYISIPKGGIVHQFKNESDKVAHLICTVVPTHINTIRYCYLPAIRSILQRIIQNKKRGDDREKGLVTDFGGYICFRKNIYPPRVPWL